MFETPIHWVTGISPYRIGLMSRPRGDEYLCSEVEAWSNASVNIVVSLLENSEIQELGLKQEASLCAKHLIQFYSFPIPDRSTPVSLKEFRKLINELLLAIFAGKSVAIHCRAGIGRTGLVAGCLLYCLGVQLKNIFHILSKSRGIPMPDTIEQVKWVETHAHLLYSET